MLDFFTLKRIIEAALLAVEQPLSISQLLSLFDEQATVSHDDVARALEELGHESTGRGIELVEVASGFRYQICQDIYPWVSRLWAERPAKYSRALLETLVLIAYRQPITRGEIEEIRGVAVSSSIIKTLEEREWIRVVGHRDVPGKPAIFGTTRAFLDYFKLKSLDELPPLAEIRDLEELEPQLELPPLAMTEISVSPLSTDQVMINTLSTGNIALVDESILPDKKKDSTPEENAVIESEMMNKSTLEPSA